MVTSSHNHEKKTLNEATILLNQQMAIIPIKVFDCRRCPLGVVSKYYTPDSFDDCVQVHCKALGGKEVGIYDWNDKDRIYHKCPFLQDSGHQLDLFTGTSQ
jgi:hypothetical protein